MQTKSRRIGTGCQGEFEGNGLAAMKLLSQRYMIEILVALNVKEPVRFGKLVKLTGGSPNTIRQRLQELEGLGLGKRIVASEMPPRVFVELTESGRSLANGVQFLEQFELQAANNPSRSLVPVAFVSPIEHLAQGPRRLS